MRAVDVVQKKRDGAELTREEIDFFIRGYARGDIPDYQASAFTMAVFFKGMAPAEIVALTESMMRTGEVLDLSDLPGPKVDKHSTGGVGDKTSLVLAPLAAACGVYVPMISGRGLGHTGGTLDKLESIPGFNVRLSLAELRAVLRDCGLGLIGQTPEIAPADRKLYALRDVTATVESLPLISASIMSKKMAEGIDALVLDVKCGDGAFLRGRDEARALAETMLGIGKGMGKKVAALITDMDQPLGRTAGNALEVAECVETLKGRGPTDLESLSVELAAWMVHLAGVTAVSRRGEDAGARRRSRAGPASSASGAWSSSRAATPASATTPRCCPRPWRRSWCAPSATGAWRASPRGRSGTPGCSWARAARRSTGRSTPRSASSSTRRWATRWRSASPSSPCTSGRPPAARMPWRGCGRPSSSPRRPLPADRSSSTSSS